MISAYDVTKKTIQPRPRNSHKGTFGRVLLIGGCYPYGGAIIMAALACVNSGAGLVTVATANENISSLHAHLPESMAFDIADRKRLGEQIQAADVILIGSGLGEDDLAKQSLDMVLNLVSDQQTLLIDGSALNLLAKKEEVSWQCGRLILTPHQKEWERLSGLAIAEQRPAVTQAALAHFPKNTILVAKSQETIVYAGERACPLGVGGPYQATGGMGDTLAGMIAGFVAQFKDDSFEAVVAASFLHSYIAQELAKEAYVVLPTKISQQIPKTMKYFENLD